MFRRTRSSQAARRGCCATSTQQTKRRSQSMGGNTNPNAVPFLDLVTPHRELREELSAVFTKVIETAYFIGGPMVENFEREFATFCNAQHCIGLSSGTDAVRFALMAAGVKP